MGCYEYQLPWSEGGKRSPTGPPLTLILNRPEEATTNQHRSFTDFTVQRMKAGKLCCYAFTDACWEDVYQRLSDGGAERHPCRSTNVPP